MTKTITTIPGILIVLLVAGVAGASVLLFNQDVEEEVVLEEETFIEEDEIITEDGPEPEEDEKTETEPGPKPDPKPETDSEEELEKKREEKVESFLELRLKPFMDAIGRVFGRDRFALEPFPEEDRELKQEVEDMGEYFRGIDTDIENFDYEEMKVAQEKIESFYEFLIEFYPEDAERMKNHDNGREYDNSDFFEI